MKWYNRLFNRQGLVDTAGTQSALNFSGEAAQVNFDSAMTISAWWASCRLVAETMASMPLKCYRVDGKVTTLDTEYPLWRMLNFYPNAYQTRTEFFETNFLNLVATGNYYCLIQRSGGKIVALHPVQSGMVTPVVLDDGSIVYEIYDRNGGLTVYSQKSVWHVKMFGNGIVGMSPLSNAARSLGIALATENRFKKLAENGGKNSGILFVDRQLNDVQKNQLRKKYANLTVKDTNELIVLEADMKYTPISLSPHDMQVLESRRFQVEDIARFVGVPSVLINDTSSSTVWGSGISQIVDGFHKLRLRTEARRVENSIEKWLQPAGDWGIYSIEFDFDDLLRADLKTRLETLGKAINDGVYMPDEARELEGLPPVVNGNKLYLNGTMKPIDSEGLPSEND